MPSQLASLLTQGRRYNRLVGVLLFIGAVWFLWPMLVPGDSHVSTPIDTSAPGAVKAAPKVPVIPPKPKPTPKQPDLSWNEKAEKVKEAFIHGYDGFEKHALPSDELLPLSHRKKNNFNGWGVTTVDSMDTMLLMGLDEYYERALKHVEKIDFKLHSSTSIPFFETVIRYLGGFLAAYALRPNPMLLKRADELGGILSVAFNTTSGLPKFGVIAATGETTGGNIGILSEIASCQLEYSYLAKLTGKKEYYDVVDKMLDTLYTADLAETGGMFPTEWDLTTGQPFKNHLAVGGQADSAHEYLLKQYLLTAKTDKASLEMYLRATTQIFTRLLYISPMRGMLYSVDDFAPRMGYKLEHLACFLPGLLAVGAHILPLDKLSSVGIDFAKLGEGMSKEIQAEYVALSKYNLKQLHMWVAEGLAETCSISYADMASGLGPDEMTFFKAGYEQVRFMDALAKWKKSGARGTPPGAGVQKPVEQGDWKDYSVRNHHYFLRPETVESVFFMWKTTGEQRWRDRGWAIFEAIEKQTRSYTGYAIINDVDTDPAPKSDSMPSYFLAETLKYLYLLFLDEDKLPIDKWVFNTEAHPFPVFEWTAEEKKQFGIP